METHFDAIVIGTGQAGPPLAARLSLEGLKTAVIERKRFGGTCVNTGCTPTKTLVASARVAHLARRAAEFGVTLGGPVGVDPVRVKARKDAIVAAGARGIEDWMTGLQGVSVLRAHARFVAPRSLSVNGDLLTADRIFINTGGRATVPDIPGLAETGWLDNTTILELDRIPEHLLIVGGSYIGLEFAQVYRRFGSRVTVLEMADRLIPHEDRDVSEAVRAILAAEGIDIRLNVSGLRVARNGGGIEVHARGDDGAGPLRGSDLLLAVGRRPNTDDLGLQAAGIATDNRGYIIVDDELATNVPGVWALGDVNGRGAFTHTAYDDYEILASNLFEGGTRRVSDRIPCYALFTDPPLGRVGMTERDVREEGRKALVARRDMTRVSRARERSETQGFLKVLVDAESRAILGAALLGIGGDEVVHALLDLMAARAPYTVLRDTMHIHPTVAEYLPTLMEDLQPLT